MIVLVGNRNWIQKVPTLLKLADEQDILVFKTDAMLTLAQSAAERMGIEVAPDTGHRPRMMTEETFKTMEVGKWVYDV